MFIAPPSRPHLAPALESVVLAVADRRRVRPGDIPEARASEHGRQALVQRRARDQDFEGRSRRIAPLDRTVEGGCVLLVHNRRPGIERIEAGRTHQREQRAAARPHHHHGTFVPVQQLVRLLLEPRVERQRHGPALLRPLREQRLAQPFVALLGGESAEDRIADPLDRRDAKPGVVVADRMDRRLAQRVAPPPHVARNRRGQNHAAPVEDRPARHLQLGRVRAFVVAPHEPHEIRLRVPRELPRGLIRQHGEKRARDDRAQQPVAHLARLDRGSEEHRQRSDGQEGQKSHLQSPKEIRSPVPVQKVHEHFKHRRLEKKKRASPITQQRASVYTIRTHLSPDDFASAAVHSSVTLSSPRSKNAPPTAFTTLTASTLRPCLTALANAAMSRSSAMYLMLYPLNARICTPLR